MGPADAVEGALDRARKRARQTADASGQAPSIDTQKTLIYGEPCPELDSIHARTLSWINSTKNHMVRSDPELEKASEEENNVAATEGTAVFYGFTLQNTDLVGPGDMEGAKAVRTRKIVVRKVIKKKVNTEGCA